MNKIPVLPVILVLALVIAGIFLLLPRTEQGIGMESVAIAPHSAMPVPEDAPDPDETIGPPMGDVDRALTVIPAPEASIMPAAPQEDQEAGEE